MIVSAVILWAFMFRTGAVSVAYSHPFPDRASCEAARQEVINNHMQAWPCYIAEVKPS